MDTSASTNDDASGDSRENDGRPHRLGWSEALQQVAETHRNSSQAAKFAGDEEAAARHLRAAQRAERVVEELRLLPASRPHERSGSDEPNEP